MFYISFIQYLNIYIQFNEKKSRWRKNIFNGEVSLYTESISELQLRYQEQLLSLEQ